MSELYEYTIFMTCPAELTASINGSGSFSQTCEYVLVEDQNQVSVSMTGPLSEAEQTTLENYVMNYTCSAAPSETEEDQSPPGETDPNTGETVSYAEMCFMFAESQITNNDWVQIGHASDTYSGYIMPENGTITRVTAHVESQNKTGKKSIDLYINDTKYDDFITFGGLDTEQSDDDYEGDDDGWYSNQHRIRNNLNINFNVGDKIRLRGAMSSSYKLYDTCIAIWYKWRI